MQRMSRKDIQRKYSVQNSMFEIGTEEGDCRLCDIEVVSRGAIWLWAAAVAASIIMRCLG